MTRRETTIAYYQGMKEGLWRYAWYKDGVQYVGSGMQTLKEATAKVDAECAKELEQLNFADAA